MLTAQELGELVLKVQADDLQPKDLRHFLREVITDAEVRRNLKLAGVISGLPREVREKHCLANVLFLMSHSTLAPAEPPKFMVWRPTTTLFKEKFQVCVVTTWKQHIFAKKDPKSTAVRARPELEISNELAAYLQALEDFWDVQGLLVAV